MAFFTWYFFYCPPSGREAFVNFVFPLASKMSLTTVCVPFSIHVNAVQFECGVLANRIIHNNSDKRPKHKQMTEANNPFPLPVVAQCTHTHKNKQTLQYMKLKGIVAGSIIAQHRPALCRCARINNATGRGEKTQKISRINSFLSF